MDFADIDKAMEEFEKGQEGLYERLNESKLAIVFLKAQGNKNNDEITLWYNRSESLIKKHKLYKSLDIIRDYGVFLEENGAYGKALEKEKFVSAALDLEDREEERREVEKDVRRIEMKQKILGEVEKNPRTPLEILDIMIASSKGYQEKPDDEKKQIHKDFREIVESMMYCDKTIRIDAERKKIILMERTIYRDEKQVDGRTKSL